MRFECADCGCVVDRGVVAVRCGDPECCCQEMPDAMASQYLFDNAQPQAGRGFSSLEAAFDAWTLRQLEVIGVAEGWRCLEVGGGGGSIGRRLAERVGPTGRVTVTDINPVWAAEAQPANVEVLCHDIAADALPERAFDLVHARLVLIHVPERDRALRSMVSALRPGGWLLVEDFDMRVLRDGGTGAMVRTPLSEGITAADVELLARVDAALLTLLEGRGADLAYGRRLYGLLRAEGLLEVAAEGYMAISPGGSPAAAQRLIRYEQIAGELVASGSVTAADLERARALLRDPACPVLTPGILVSARGRRPPRPS
jgi:ubiquinone/menaquinone biosynthesis C-methylase UbiE